MTLIICDVPVKAYMLLNDKNHNAYFSCNIYVVLKREGTFLYGNVLYLGILDSVVVLNELTILFRKKYIKHYHRCDSSLEQLSMDMING